MFTVKSNKRPAISQRMRADRCCSSQGVMNGLVSGCPAIVLCFMSLFAFSHTSQADPSSTLTKDGGVYVKNEAGEKVPELGRLYTESVHILGGGRRPVARWYDTVRVAVLGARDKATLDIIDSIFTQISLMTGLRIRTLLHDFDNVSDYIEALHKSPAYDLALCDVDSPEICANFVIVVAEKPAMHEIAVAFPLRPVFQRATATARTNTDEILCFFSPGISGHTRIVQSMVYVQQDIDEALRHTCLQEEIYQSFGLFGDFTNASYFSFNNKVRPKQITAYDRRLLASLYDKAFPPGTAAATVAKQLSAYCESHC